MNAKRLTPFIAFVILSLSGCASAMARPQTVVQTAVVTQLVEGTPMERIVTAQATAAPAATGAPATAAPIPDSAMPGDPQLNFAPVGTGLVIKDAELELLVLDTDRAMNQVTQMTGDAGGYIISSQTWYGDGFKFASLKLGIPSANFESSLTYLRGLALQIVRENATGQDVSAAYTDLQSELTNLEATAARVREFLADAKTVEESLRISGQLSELEVQIETIKGQMRFYEGRAAYSTVTVFLTPQYPTPTPSQTPTSTPTATPTSTPTAWNPGTTFGQASGVLVGMTQTTVDLLIWAVVVGGPIVLIFGLVLTGARLARRK